MHKVTKYKQRYIDPKSLLGEDIPLEPDMIKELGLYFKILPPGLIGKTNKCVVLKGKYLQNNREYAVKIAAEGVSLIEEANLLMTLRHPSIVMFKKMLLIQERVCLV